MSQQDSKSASISPNGCGCLLLLMGIGAIGAIALPSFLGDSAHDKYMKSYMTFQVQQYVSSVNRGQQAYFAEKKAFSTSVKAVGIGIETETTPFKYSRRVTKKAAFSYAVAKENDFKSYVGGVFMVPAKKFAPKAAKEDITTTSILCEADSPGTIQPAEPTYENGKIACGKGTTQLPQ
ncbi:type IV pilin-like G/H family protein [Microcoleus sp. MON1_C5]|uniref:type IV pilin-like G/H family protein n=1 Tax=Microcoleus sp. MON1_C5 TaxID=2818828 RepID=UPI002FD44B98